MSIQKFSIALLVAASLAGCVTTPGYRSGVGDYYYGSPSTSVYDYGYGNGYGGYGYGAPYGSVGYGGYGYPGSGWGGGLVYGLGFGSGYYGSGYYGGYGYGGYGGGYYGGGYYGGGYYPGGYYPGYHPGGHYPRPPRPQPHVDTRRPQMPGGFIDDGTRYRSRYQGGSTAQQPLYPARGNAVAPDRGTPTSRYPVGGGMPAGTQPPRGEVQQRGQFRPGSLPPSGYAPRPGGLRPGVPYQPNPTGSSPGQYPQAGGPSRYQPLTQPQRQQGGFQQSYRGVPMQPPQPGRNVQAQPQQRMQPQQQRAMPMQAREAPRQSAPVSAPQRRARSADQDDK